MLPEKMMARTDIVPMMVKNAPQRSREPGCETTFLSTSPNSLKRLLYESRKSE